MQMLYNYYISLLVIPCIIYYVTNKETLTLILRIKMLVSLLMLSFQLHYFSKIM